MITKALKYLDLDGQEQIENHMFGMTKAELAEMELTTDGGMAERMKAISATNNAKEVFLLMKEILKRAYGIRSEDGKRFMKREEYWQEFTETGAYDSLIMELLTDAPGAADFFTKIVPDDLQEKVREGQKILDDGQQELSKEQMLALSDEEWNARYGKDPHKWPREVMLIGFERKQKAIEANAAG